MTVGVFQLDQHRIPDPQDQRPRYGPLDILSRAELAAFFGKSPRTIDRLGIPHVIVGREPFYPWPAVVDFLRGQVT